MEKVRLGPGDMFGHVALLTGVAHDGTAQAVGDVVLEVIGRTDIGGALARQPEAASSLLAAAFVCLTAFSLWAQADNAPRPVTPERPVHRPL